MPLLAVGVLAVVATRWWAGLSFWGFGLLATGLACYFRFGVHRGRPMILVPPVTGRWIAVNSPADRVPSHGVTAYGQGQAVDLVHDPVDGGRPGFAWWPLARPPQDFPGYGEPVRSPVDGVVVRVVRRRRDHWSRTSWPALGYFLIEGFREILGPSQVLGNHVIIRAGARHYAAVAHLRRGSVLVRRGHLVRAGDQIAECGNSGNSTEPHVHMQVMDHPNPLFAAGVPFVFDAGDAGPGMPHAHEALPDPRV